MTTTFIVPGAEETYPDTIANDGWFPDIDPKRARDAMRLDGSVSDERLRLALINAMISVYKELKGWKQQKRQEGYDSLEQVPMIDSDDIDDGMEIDGASVYLHLYNKAVYCLAAAECVDRYRNFDVTHTGQDKAQEMDLTHGGLLRDARNAIADIIGSTRCVIELI